MQHSGMLNSLRQSVVRQRAAGVCRLPQQQQQTLHNSVRASCPAATGVQDAAVASVSSPAIPDVLPPSTNGLSKKQGASSYSTAAAPLPADIKRVLFSAAQVQEKVAELAAQICKDHKGKPLALIGVLNGAFIFTSDLAREVSKEIPDVKVDFMRASSYGSASESSGDVTVKGVSNLAKWENYNIVLVEDIIDSGHTLARLSKVLTGAGADSVKVVALLDKKGRRRVEFFPDYVGWECPNEFVVGYGLDFNENYRCLPYVAALKEEAYAGSSH